LRELLAGVSLEDPSTFENLTFGQTLRYLRVSENLTQREIEKRLGYSDSSQGVIARYERDKSVPKNLEKIIQSFGWEEDDSRAQLLRTRYMEGLKKGPLSIADISFLVVSPGQIRVAGRPRS